jgi:3-oxoacyl-[acyl-carrier protein] reductase
MDTGLLGKVVLITGASGGIGGATARKFAEEGARLGLHYHTRRAAVEALQAELAVETLALGGDLTDEAQVVALFQQAADHLERVDTLVVNAGIWVAEDVPLHQMSLAQWERTIQVDLTSAFLCCREFFRLVARQKRGNVVLVASTAAVFGEAGHVDYAAAKSALAYGLTRTLKNEIARLAPHRSDYCGGRVNCVCPGWTVTEMTRDQLQDAESVRRLTATMALPQIARGEDVANLIVYLASDTLARHLTGQILVLAGGMEGRVLWAPGEVDATIV